MSSPRGSCGSGLRGKPAITLAHHSAGQPIPTNWTFAPDPVLEPVTEVSSVHGTSEALDCPSVLRGAIPGNFVRDALEHGYELGFIASGDSHDGHPGLPHLNPSYGYRPPRAGRPALLGNGGVAALVDCERTRASALATLRARRVYASSGPRALLFVELEGHPGGSRVRLADLPRHPTLTYELHATGPVRAAEWIARGRKPKAVALEAGALDAAGTVSLPRLDGGDFVYLRVEQEDGGLVWSSPIFVR